MTYKDATLGSAMIRIDLQGSQIFGAISSIFGAQLDFQKLQEIKRSEFLGISCDELNDIWEKRF